MNALKYFLYARKSTDEDDRQILSIESQLTELREFGSKERLTIAQEFTESMSAKVPGHPIFNRLSASPETHLRKRLSRSRLQVPLKLNCARVVLEGEVHHQLPGPIFGCVGRCARSRSSRLVVLPM